MLERLKVGGEGANRVWDDWLASLTQWTWVWASSGCWWLTGRPGMLQSMGLQSQTQLSNWTELNWPYNWKQSQIQCNLYQNTEGIFHRSRTNNSKIFMGTQKPWIATTVLRNKNKAEGTTFPYFKLFHEATVVKTVWYWHRSRHTSQWNRTDCPEMNPHLYEQLICDKIGKNI